ncbi:hypothetical protein [Streptacidiphilus sp. MAP5-3]
MSSRRRNRLTAALTTALTCEDRHTRSEDVKESTKTGPDSPTAIRI